MEARRQRQRVLNRVATFALVACAVALPARPAFALNNANEVRKWPWHAGVAHYITTRPGQCPHCSGRESSSAWKAVDANLDHETVYSISGGVVDQYDSGGGSAAGKYLRVKDTDGTYFTYEHLTKALVTKGGTLWPGQPVGVSGCTGRCSGPHLHFQRQSGPSFGSNAVDMTPISGVTSIANQPYTSDNAGIGYSASDVVTTPIRTSWTNYGGLSGPGVSANVGDNWTPCQNDSVKGSWWRINCSPRSGIAGTIQTFLSQGNRQSVIMSQKGTTHGFILYRGVLGAYTSQLNGHDWVYWLGYPLGNRYAISSGGYKQVFQNGYILQPASCTESVSYNSNSYTYGFCD